jgi:hypothetical protein
MSVRLGFFAALTFSLIAPALSYADGSERGTVSGPAPAKPAQSTPAPDPTKLCDKPKSPGADAGTVSMTGVVTKGAKAITDPISWTVSRLSGDCRGQVVATKKAPQFTIPLDPGDYRIRGQYDTVEASTQITVGKQQKLKQEVDFRAAKVTFRMIPHSGAPAIDDPVSWKVYQYVKGNGGIGRQVGEGLAPYQRFMLREGAYVVRATYSDTVTDLVVPVKAGETFKYTVNLYSGQVMLKALDKQKNAVRGKVVYEVSRARVGADGKHEVLVTRTSPSEPLMLREGKYIVTARAGDKTGKTVVDVQAGKTKNVVVTIP